MSDAPEGSDQDRIAQSSPPPGKRYLSLGRAPSPQAALLHVLPPHVDTSSRRSKVLAMVEGAKAEWSDEESLFGSPTKDGK